jgi:uncharacterized membrane protein
MTEKFLASFFRGLLLVAPVAITGFALVSALTYVDNLFHIEFPGLGILIVISGITVVGALSQTFLIDPILARMEKLITKLPLAALIYSSVKDLLSAFVGEKKKFDQPVLVELLPGSQIKKIGFITQPTLGLAFGDEVMAVYFPHSYNISGEVMIVPMAQISKLDIKSADAMKFVVSGGLAFHSKETNS